jgi:hypothetical protein
MLTAPSSVIDIALENPRTFSDQELREVQMIIQDIFAETSHELFICRGCGEIYGKKQFFHGKIPAESYSQSVNNILNGEYGENLSCHLCGSHQIELIHPIEKGIMTTKKRVMSALEVKSIVSRNEDGRIVWYGEVYVDKFERAYENELVPHYPNIWSVEMRMRIEQALQKVASTMLVLPFIGILPEHRSHALYAKFLRHFFTHVKFDHDESPWLMEVARNGPVYRVFRSLGGVSLNETDPLYFTQQSRASKYYNSSILVFPSTMRVFRERFAWASDREILIGR